MNVIRKEEEKFCIRLEWYFLYLGDYQNLWGFVNYTDSYSPSSKIDLESSKLHVM